MDLEVELISALTEMKKERKNNKLFKEENIYLKNQLEEGISNAYLDDKERKRV